MIGAFSFVLNYFFFFHFLNEKIMISILLLFWWVIVGINGYIVQGRFGHSAVQVNDRYYRETN